MATKIQVRRGTSASWTGTNPVLSSGEIGFETDTNKLKIGNGSSVWSSLNYFSDIQEITSASAYSLEQANEYTDQQLAAVVFDSAIVTASAAAVNYLVDGAPEALDTLNELAAALDDNENILSTLLTLQSASSIYAPSNSPTFSGSADFTAATVIGVDTLPSQTGNDGKYLTTDGTDASWASITTDPTPTAFLLGGM